MFYDKLQEHLAHSAPCASRWDGFDRGDDGREVPEVVSMVIGRMTSKAGRRVVIYVEGMSNETTEFYRVTVDGETVFWDEEARTQAIEVGRRALDDLQ